MPAPGARQAWASMRLPDPVIALAVGTGLAEAGSVVVIRDYLCVLGQRRARGGLVAPCRFRVGKGLLGQRRDAAAHTAIGAARDLVLVGAEHLLALIAA